jgi:putative hydrolase of the HAD superfamily
MKVDRSGLGRYFAHTAIVKEKDAPAYRRLVEDRGFRPAETWMIGNSPKSDINPALEAGLNAVLVPHPHTWVLEHQDLREGGERLRIVANFGELRNYF